MAKDSKLLNIGDSLIVTVNPIANGKVSLSSYVDELIGITGTRYVKREFRISTEDIFYTDWNELNDQNLSKFSEVIAYSFYIEVKYTRIGTDTTGEIEFVKIDFSGSFEESNLVAPTIKSSIFSKIIDSQELSSIENNLFKKLYRRGILPDYITRGENSYKDEDIDFFSMFSSVAKYFAMFFKFSKRFDQMNTDEEFMREVVNGYRIFYDESSITLSELQYLSSHYLDEIRKRGTDMIFKYSGDKLVDGNIVPIDGEFLRLFRNKKNDEMCREILNKKQIGWCLSNCSPLYRGTSNSKYLNKTLELSEDFQSLDNFQLFQSGFSSHYIQEYEDKNVLNLSVNSGSCGLGRIDDVVPEDKLIKVATNLDYEITFAFKLTNNTDSELLFSVEGFDNLKNKLGDSFILPDYSEINEMFFTIPTSNLRTDSWYHVRGIIHSYSTDVTSRYKTNIGFGDNLYFNNRFVKYILPTIALSGQSGNVKIWNYKIRPLVRGKNIRPLKNGDEISHSLGFIQSSKLLYVYVKNNNNNLSVNQISDLVEKYLIPYDVEGIYMLL